ncbi:bifunctional tRNA (5-methylaminomethyl-2-thiouridine)(34)-methyltransferase MnmD/FAD-dependent 5-carboxymethylaminomethyl-2-thiouridine(34) oxidoreductase MnmC [Pandoraea anhela]|uniref:tRNA 5-methylaminomethyl-2-thiouridine biosynthesis bifunctional protein MnmC n=1 Tax=Pandoraea anhela TaxID=2508295 RepID=A0A5E4YED9_9BURK|nr:bifunctional tRNA (5-methylaminomethyl-2-thiouridine)(34)-methyltransferase MnmD/FAD-dependent 5-carboxymethylaminomethyl-2-thiouridine(34) oxidoreductase MnmC [Pandoraea anhela]VVE46503.1 bifunctional tRNA (5-methylaminomethyl-2-thiouridine)(34)-methyltransferase MnmD/FAD-dependent 5-carboxymethylaminomethyl-2-thiouridine(34)oxidoreductase MnmC [Pandoraea anhela]
MSRRPGIGPITPAQPSTTEDGTPYSDTFEDVYHSTGGALGQARYVFLGGNGLPERWRGRGQFVIVETGFGLGLNFLATWAAWRDDPQRPARLHFVSVEKHPFRALDLRRMLEPMLVQPGMTELAPLVQRLCDMWPSPVAGWHRLELAPGVVLSVGFGDASELLPSLRVGADAFYLDGFSPSKNPDIWTPDIFKTLGRLARDGATLATYTAVGQVRRDLIAAGFQVARQHGYGPKRSMLAGPYAPPYRMRRYDPPAAPTPRASHPREAIVVGAGMAGAAMARRLVARGWRVRLFERAQAPGTAASGNPAGVFHPQLSADDNVLSRLTRAGFLYALSQWRTLPGGLPGRADGLLQVAATEAEAHALQQLMAAHAYPEAYAKWVDASQASALAGETLTHGGVWYPEGGWLAPAMLCRAELVAAGPSLDARYGVSVAQLVRRDDGRWAALDETGRELAVADAVVVTAADVSQKLLAPYLDPAFVPVRRVRGQLTFLPPDALPSLRVPVCGDGYVAPSPLAGAGPVTGATYGFDDPAETVRLADHQANLRRLAALLPAHAEAFGDAGLASERAAAELGGRTAFRALAPDRLPMAGQLPDMRAIEPQRRRLSGGHLRDLPRLDGLYASFAFGSRGLVFASLCAELVASQLEGEPWPIGSDLADAIDPARYLMQALRKV